MEELVPIATTTPKHSCKWQQQRPKSRAIVLLAEAVLLLSVLGTLCSLHMHQVACHAVPSAASATDAIDQSLQNNELDGGRLSRAQVLARQAAAAAVGPFRFRRHTPATATSGAALKQAQQALLEGDEQVLRRQLPDLIAQAHQDKTVERALLRMLINASLRSSLSNMVASSQQASPASNSNSANWQLDDDNSLTQYNQIGGEFVPIRAARTMEQAQGGSDSALANLDSADLSSLTASIQQLNGQLQPLIEQQQMIQQSQQFQPSQMDKREYIKPCSFNAISCVRTPYRKL